MINDISGVVVGDISWEPLFLGYGHGFERFFTLWVVLGGFDPAFYVVFGEVGDADVPAGFECGLDWLVDRVSIRELSKLLKFLKNWTVWISMRTGLFFYRFIYFILCGSFCIRNPENSQGDCQRRGATFFAHSADPILILCFWTYP